MKVGTQDGFKSFVIVLCLAISEPFNQMSILPCLGQQCVLDSLCAKRI